MSSKNPTTPRLTRRRVLAMGGSALTLAATPMTLAASPKITAQGESMMYGLIGKIRSTPGKREELMTILLEGTSNMPGCLSYVIARDPADEDAFWVTEVWDSQESHAASLSLPEVQEAIGRGRPLIAGFEERYETEPVGGHGLG